jgi:F-type H+-transporting ATPase subunit a
MHLSPDEIVFWQYGFFKLNLTIVTTWFLMLVLVLMAKLATRKVIAIHHPVKVSHWQSLLEVIVSTIKQQIAAVGLQQPEKYMGFIGTLFLFVAVANIFTIFPMYEPPTGSLSTTAALAICVLVAVPLFGIRALGLIEYLKDYIQPTVVMLPFNIISELSRTLALAMRLFGNMMSGSMIIAILLTITPFLFPIVMSVLGLLTGMVQAYIFSILATVYIAAATSTHDSSSPAAPTSQKN